MRRIGIAMEKLNRIFRRGIGDSLVNMIFDSHSAHRNSAICKCFCHGDNIRGNAKTFRSKWLTCSAKPCDYLIKYQQNFMLITYLAQTFQIANRRHNRTGRAGDWLNKYRRDGRTAIGFTNTHQIFCQLCTCLGLAF